MYNQRNCLLISVCVRIQTTGKMRRKHPIRPFMSEAVIRVEKQEAICVLKAFLKHFKNRIYLAWKFASQRNYFNLHGVGEIPNGQPAGWLPRIILLLPECFTRETHSAIKEDGGIRTEMLLIVTVSKSLTAYLVNSIEFWETVIL